MRTILLTGASGLIGSYILKYLIEEAGYTDIRLYGRRYDPLWDQYGDTITFIQGDIMYAQGVRNAIQGVDYVIHSAAMVSFDPADRSKMYEVNIEGTANIVNACIAESIGKFLFVSSVSSLGRSKEQKLPIDESSKWKEGPYESHYARTKYISEIEAWRAYAEGVPTVIINPSIVLGSGDWRRSSLKIIEEIYRGLSYYPKGSSGFTDVRDVAIIAQRLIESDINGQRFVVAGSNLTYRKLFEMVARNLGKPFPSKPLPRVAHFILPLISRIGALLTGQPTAITKETLRVSSLNVSYDSSKVIQATGIQFRPIENTIQACCENYTRSLKEQKRIGRLLDF